MSKMREDETLFRGSTESHQRGHLQKVCDNAMDRIRSFVNTETATAPHSQAAVVAQDRPD